MPCIRSPRTGYGPTRMRGRPQYPGGCALRRPPRGAPAGAISAHTVLPDESAVQLQRRVRASTNCRPRPRAARRSTGCSRGSASDSSRTSTRNAVPVSDTVIVSGVRACSTALANSSLTTSKASSVWSESTPQPASTWARRCRAFPGTVGSGANDQRTWAVPASHGRSSMARTPDLHLEPRYPWWLRPKPVEGAPAPDPADGAVMAGVVDVDVLSYRCRVPAPVSRVPAGGVRSAGPSPVRAHCRQSLGFGVRRSVQG